MHNADRSKTPHQSEAAQASLNEARTTGGGSETSNQGESPVDSPSPFRLLTFLPGRRGTNRAVLQGTSTRGLFIYCTLGIKTGGERRPTRGGASTALDEIAPSVNATPLRASLTRLATRLEGTTLSLRQRETKPAGGKATCGPSANSLLRGIPRD